jgi:anti-sigma28 factor (negative regulator of flagellin synthesis)
MKIDPIQSSGIVRNNKVTKAYQTYSDNSTFKPDELSVSSDALSFSKVMSVLKDKLEVTTPAEQAHIDDVTKKIRLGTYNVDSSLVAERILSALTPPEGK